MRNDCYYVSSTGKVFNFKAEYRFMNRSEIRDYEWKYVENFNRVKTFSRDLQTKSITIFFVNKRSVKNSLQTTAEQFYRIADEDVRRMQMGKLYYNDYYINCYIIGSTKENYDSGVVISETISILSDFVWRHDVQKVFVGGYSNVIPTTGIDYPYDYMYDYAPDYDNRRIDTGAVAPYDFTVIFNGYYLNPQIVVNGHIYRVYLELMDGETLTIDSVNKTITRIKADGTKVNEIDSRDRNNYVFQKMEEVDGISIVDIEDDHRVTLTAHIERSEPTWI